MVFPNFFYYLCKAQLSHIPHSLHIPSRERRHRPAPPLPPGAILPSWHTRCPHALSARDCLTRCTSQRAMLTRHAHAMHPRPHSILALRATTPRKELRTRAATRHHTPLMAHTRYATPPHKGGYATHAATNAPKASLSPCNPPLLLRRKSEPPQPKYYILQYYM